MSAQELFNCKLRELTTNLVTASAAPYRNVEAYPPITLGNVAEADLQAQWEQIAVPYHVPFGVDFYQRPGKRAWTHPEIWNDAGTGDQVIPNLFLGLMRGVNGIGLSGYPVYWPATLNDPRSSYRSLPSIYRALNALVSQYGPWLATLDQHDPVAIVASGRHFRIDEWGAVMGRHFARLFEAYVSCLHAHYPARMVFAEDLQPDTLSRFKAVLVVGQTVEYEPGLAQALQRAKAAGVTVFYDGTCRESLVKDFRPLGIAFDQFATDPHPASDDHAYWRFAAYAQRNVPALQAAFGPLFPAAATTDNAEILMSERVNGDGRYLFVVNHTSPVIEPAQLWRMTLAVATRVPVVAPIHLPNAVGSEAVYDVFGHRRVTPTNGVVQADLNTLPARLYAILPRPIDGVTVTAHQDRCVVKVRGPQTTVPVQVTMRDKTGTVLRELHLAVPPAGQERPLPAGTVSVEARELFSGQLGRSTPTASAATVADARHPTPDTLFGSHLRDVAVDAAGELAVFNAMNWEHNLYAVDLRTGATRWRQRLGQYFAFAPEAVRDGFAVQGYDFNAAAGYHLYLTDNRGQPSRRFALTGVPGRLPQRFVPGILNDRVNNFAVAASGRWVASAGNLGLAVWDRTGALQWSQDWVADPVAHEARLAVLDDQTLLVADGLSATAYEARTGKARWQLSLGTTGAATLVRTTRDGQLCAIATSTDGGQILVVRSGRIVRRIPTAANDFVIADDGQWLAVGVENQLKLYSIAAGLRWILPADDSVRVVRFARDSRRVAAASDLGTVYVTDVEGTLQLERDFGSAPVLAWLPDGDLVVGTWMGHVARLDGAYRSVWESHLQPGAADLRGQLLAHDPTPTTAHTYWNASPTPREITDNLLNPTNVLIRFAGDAPHVQFVHPPARLVDGNPQPLQEPWLSWTVVGTSAELSPVNYILVDTYYRHLHIEAITLVEDPAHPESWLRDLELEYWDDTQERWLTGSRLLSDAATHTHHLTSPIETSRIRLRLPHGITTNIRLGELVLHGRVIGAANPDVRAQRSVAVLFDEGNELGETLVSNSGPLRFRFAEAFHGGRCLALETEGSVAPPFRPPFGHALPHWGFPVNPEPRAGEYRWLQFAWRALAPETRGLTLRVQGMEYGRTVAISAGATDTRPGEIAHPVAAAPPAGWQVVRVDLATLLGSPVSIKAMTLSAQGGPAAFDQILLGRTEADLPDKP